MIASPVIMDGVAYISCFVHLTDPTDLTALEALGVMDIQPFEGLDFVAAEVPVAQLEALAALDNVTSINVAELMHPTTDAARRSTFVNDLLTLSPEATGRGINTRYDGTGVIMGVIDQGIDYHHIAFQDKDGNCRIKQAFVFDGSRPSAALYYEEDMINPDSMPTTDNIYADHGTHTASIAGGSSVIVDRIDGDHYTLRVTEAHDSATYGGMAPGTDLYLAGIYNLTSVMLARAMYLMATYADTVGGTGKPLVVSNSWGASYGPRNGNTYFTQLTNAFFGEDHPNRIMLFATGNDAGQGGTGGIFVRKQSVDAAAPLGTILRNEGTQSNNYGGGMLTNAWADTAMHCKLYVLDNTNGEVLWSRTFTSEEETLDGIYNVGVQNDTTVYYTGQVTVYLGYEGNFKSFYAVVESENVLTTTTSGAYVLALEVYPAEGAADINLWGCGATRFVSDLATEGHTWTNGTDDMSVNNETTTMNTIAIGAYVSRNEWLNYQNEVKISGFTLGDIAYFSDYALAEVSPLGEAYPCITAPGSMLIAGVNHYHTAQVNEDSYYLNYDRLIVNDSLNPYGVMQGTSMACPTAAGIVALWLQAAVESGKSLTVNTVKDIMRRTASHDYYTTYGSKASHFGHGKIDALAGIHLITDNVLDLYDMQLNGRKISTNNDSTLGVMLCGRTLYKDGCWNTLCLPFDLTIAGSVLDGATVVELDPVTSGYQGTTLTLNFTSVSDIEAGKPYLIKWPEGTDITNPLFPNVTIQDVNTPVKSNDGSVTFLGIFSPGMLLRGDWKSFSMGANNTLYYPETDLALGAFRAAFHINNVSQAPSRIVLNVNGEEVATNLSLLPESSHDFPQADEAQKFIVNGQLYIKKGGVIYDSLGRIVKPANNNR